MTRCKCKWTLVPCISQVLNNIYIWVSKIKATVKLRKSKHFKLFLFVFQFEKCTTLSFCHLTTRTRQRKWMIRCPTLCPIQQNLCWPCSSCQWQTLVTTQWAEVVALQSWWLEKSRPSATSRMAALPEAPQPPRVKVICWHGRATLVARPLWHRVLV